MRRINGYRNSKRIRVNRINWLGLAERHADAVAMLKKPGDTILIKREVSRALVMSCPCGCGETLTVNLDERAGPAWEMYSKKKDLTIYPSVWKETGCRSHFIVWGSRIYWCSFDNDLDFSEQVEEHPIDQLIEVVRNANGEWLHFKEIARRLESVPWEILLDCRKLTANKIFSEGQGKLRGHFCLYKGQIIK